MKSKKMFGAPGDDFDSASYKGKKKHKLSPVKKQKSNRNQFLDELDEFDEDEIFLEEDREEFIEENFETDFEDSDDGFKDR